MKITKLPIEHKIKHKEPIFSIDKNDKYIVTSSINGEVKLWDIYYRPLKTFKKHEGSISTIRFSQDSKYIASAGDDGRVVIIDSDTHEMVKVIKHMMDVTHVEWGNNFLISTDIDGTIIITEQGTWTEKKRMKIDDKSITGLCISHDSRWMCVYTEGLLIMYKEFVEYRTRVLEKGIIIEMMNLRLSFAPNNMYVSVGMQFNNKTPTVDLFDIELNKMCSFIGHVAPSEVTKFFPKAYMYERKKKDDSGENEKVKYYVLAIGSQDLSISFWNTLNPKPFLLIKNFTESPVLDMCWDGSALYVSSYDGSVKKIEFEGDELGEVINNDCEVDIIDIPFSLVNIELKKSYEERKYEVKENEVKEKLEIKEKLKIIPIKPERININLKLINYTIEDGKGESVETSVESVESVKTVETVKTVESVESVETVKTIETVETVDKSMNNKLTVETVETVDKSMNKEKENENEKEKEKESTEKKKIKVENENLKRKITEKEKIVIEIKNEIKGMALFDTNISDKLRIFRTEPFKHTIGEFSIELNTTATKLSVYRNKQYFYDITENISKVCFNSKYLIVYTKYIQIYRLETGCLMMPFISYRLAFLDLLDDRVLFVNTYGNFSVMDLNKNLSWSGNLSKTKKLLQIELSREYFMLAEYSEEILFYNPDLGFWFSINPGLNTIATSKTDWENDKEETLLELEGQFRVFKMVKDETNLKIVVRKIVAYFKHNQQFYAQNDYFLEDVLRSVEDKNEYKALLEELNTVLSLQEFVDKMINEVFPNVV